MNNSSPDGDCQDGICSLETMTEDEGEIIPDRSGVGSDADRGCNDVGLVATRVGAGDIAAEVHVDGRGGKRGGSGQER